MKLVTEVLCLCLGIFIYAFFAEKQPSEYLSHMYWLSIGAVFVWFRNGLHKKRNKCT